MLSFQPSTFQGVNDMKASTGSTERESTVLLHTAIHLKALPIIQGMGTLHAYTNSFPLVFPEPTACYVKLRKPCKEE